MPWVAFLLPVSVGADDPGRLAAGAIAYLPFVALPSLLPLAAARPGRLRLLVLAVMTAVAAHAGFVILTSESSTAGLAVLEVPFVAVPLTAVVVIIDRFRRGQLWSG